VLEVGWETVKVFPFPESLERGQTVGATGGTVSSADGVELELPEGAVPVRTPVEVRLLTADELAALPVVLGFDTVAAVRVDLDGRTLAREATLRLPVPSALADGATVVLGEWIEVPVDGRGGYARLAGRIARTGDAGAASARLVAAPEPAGSVLPVAGLTREGLYLVLAAQQEIGYATGFVRSPSGLGLVDSRVTATGLGAADLSRAGGRYVAVVPTVPGAMLTALHPSLDERATAAVPALAAGDVVVVDLTVVPVPPVIDHVVPADGATDVIVGANLQVVFSEALDPATVGAGTLTLEVADSAGNGTSAYVPGAVSLVNGATVLFQPTLALPAGFRYLAHFTGGVRDAGGVPYQDGPVNWRFATSTVAAPGGQVHPELFHVNIPVDGYATIWAEPGAVPTVDVGLAWTVSPILLNTAVAPLTVGTYQVDSLGGLSPAVTIGEPPTNPITLTSEVWMRVFDPSGAVAETFRLGPFASEDGLAFVAPAGEASTFTTAEGIEVDVPEGAFDEPTTVRITTLDPSALGVPVPDNLALAGFLDIDFEGEATRSLVLHLAAPADAPTGSKVLVGAPMTFPWGRRLRLLTIGSVVEADPEHRFLTNDPEHQPTLPDLTGSGGGGGAADMTGLFVGISESTTAAWFYKPASKSIDFSLVTFDAMGNPYDAFFANEAPEWVYLPPRKNWTGRVVLPLFGGDSVTIERRDVATGWLISRQLYTSLLDPDGDGTIALEALLPPDPGPPRLVAASHFDLISFDAPRTEGETRRLRLDLQARALEGGIALVEKTPEYSGSGRSTVAVYDTSDLTAVETRFGHCAAPDQWKLPPEDGERLLAVVGPGNLDIGRVVEFAFTFSREITVDLEKLAASGEVVATLSDLGEAGPCGASGSDRQINASFRDTNRTLVVQPLGGLVAGHRYRLELRTWLLFGEGACPNGAALTKLCAGPRLFDFTVQDVRDDVLASGGEDAPAARGLIKVGNLVFTGHDDGKVRVTDVSGGGVTAGSSFTHHATISHSTGEAARAFATDGHGRVFYALRHVVAWTLWTIDVNDVYAAAPGSTLAPVPGDVQVSLGPAPADSSTSELLALGTLASGIPSDLELLVRDHESESLELEEFCAQMGCSDQLAGPLLPGGFYEFNVNLTTFGDRPSASSISGCTAEELRDRYQRASVDNVTTGQTWSVDLPWAGGGVPVTVRARRGDLVRVRHNLQTMGYLAIVGSGISVVDLNRAYRNPTASRDWAKNQCGRRLAMYQGGIFDPGDCGPGGMNPGLSMTTSVAVAPPTGCDTEGVCRRSPNTVEVFSPLMHRGLVQTSSETTALQELNHASFACLDSNLQLPSGAGSALSGAWLRDAVLATDVRWVDRGLHSPSPVCDRDHPRVHEWQVDEESARSPRVMEGDLLFVSLGESGILVFDVGSTPVPTDGTPPGRIRVRDINSLVGHLYIPGHEAFRLQVDPEMGVLFAGGNSGLLDIWDLSAINAAPGVEGVAPSQPIVSLRGVPWVADHLAVDHSGTGLLYTWGTRGDDRNVLAIPVERPRPVITGVFRGPELPADESGGGGGDGGDGDAPPPREMRPVATLMPLGVPTEFSQQLEKQHRESNERGYTAAFTVRMALPGFLAEQVKVTAETLRVRPPEEFLGTRNLGYAGVPTGGPGWPETVKTELTLRRLGGTESTPAGRFGSSFNLYESEEIVLLVSDPRALEAYELQGAPEQGAEEGELPQVDSEAGQCRRCERPSFLTDDDTVTELLAGGRYLRIRLDVESDPILQAAFPGDNLVPAAVVELGGWADDVPSPSQVSLAEPVQNPAIWGGGESALAVSLVSGELLYSSTDHAAAGRALGFSFERHYRSSLATYNPLGRGGWTSNLFAHLRENPVTGEVEYHDGRGHVWRLYPKVAPAGREKPTGDADGHFWARSNAYDLRESMDLQDSLYYVPMGLPVRLERLGSTGWRLFGLNNDSVVFDAEGRPVEFADRLRQRAGETQEQGNRVRLYYDAFGRLDRVEDEYGRVYRLRYASATAATDPNFGLLQEIEDFAGRTVTFHYNSGGQAGARGLDKVELPSVTRSVVGGSGRPAITYTFETTDFGIETPLHGELAGARLKGYTLPGRSRQTETVGWEETSGRVGTLSSPQATRPWSFQWIENEQSGQVQRADVTSPPGLMVQHHVDAKGRLWKVAQQEVPALDATDPSPEWAGGGSAPSVVPKILETVFSYTASGRVEFTRLPDGSKVRTIWRSGNRLEEGTAKKVSVELGDASPGNADYVETTTEYDYSGGVDNIPAGYSEFEGAEPTDDADVRTHLVPVVTIEGQGSEPIPMTGSHSSTLPEDSGVGESADAAISSAYWFDNLGQPTTRTDGQKVVAGGASGEVAQKTKYTYSSEVPPNAIGSGYLEAIEVGDATAKLRTEFEYDIQGAVSKVSTKDGDALLSFKTIDNDEWGRPYIVTTGLQGRYPAAEHTVSTTYDPSGRIRKQTWTQASLPGGEASVEYSYDDRDRIEWIEYTNLAGETPGEFVNKRIIYSYDDQTGLVSSVTSPGGVVQAFQYDNLGRTIRTSTGSSGPRFSAYDSMDRLVWQSDGDDGAWRGAYDAWGRLFQEEFPDGTIVGRAFDVAGALRREEIQRPSEGEGDEDVTLAKTDYYYTSVGQPWFVVRYNGSGAAGEFDDYAYDSAGREVRAVHGANDGSAPDLVSTTQYLTDGSGRVDTITDPAGNVTDYDYTGGAPWPSSVTLHEAVPATGVELSTTYRLDYDAQGRVVTATRDSDGLVVARTFDEVGNQLSEKFFAGAVPQETSMGWDAAGRMVWRAGDGGHSTSYGYDPDGRLVYEEVVRRVGSEVSEYDHDASGRLSWRELPGRRRETFTYNPDDTLDVWTMALVNVEGSAQLRVKHLYDPAGRVVRRYVDNLESFGNPSTGLAPLAEDIGDAWEYDRLGRITLAGRVTSRGENDNPLQDQLEPRSRVEYGYRSDDPRDLPETESIGYLSGWWTEVPGVITREYGAFGNLTRWTGPASIGSFTLTPDALLRRSTVTWQPASDGVITGAYSWGGTGRLMSASALGQALLNEYTAPGARLAIRGSALDGVSLGNLAFAWDGPSDLKATRDSTPAPGGLDVFGGHDWAWTQRDGARLGVSDSSKGVFEYEYGPGDELAFARYDDTVRQFGPAGALGRPSTLTGPDESESFGYDSLGRRTIDGRHRYTWSWRGDLTEVEVVDPECELAGHRVQYQYDATGRLARQTHLDAAGSLVDSRLFVWNGGELVAQVGLSHEDKVLWTVEHLPGPGGYDDSPMVRVTSGYSESIPDPPPTTRDYHLIRDEMGSVVAVFRGEPPAENEPPPLVARVLYSPYGDAHVEPGPELLSVDHDLELTMLEGAPQEEVPTTDVDGEDVPAAVPGAMVFTFSLAITVDSVPETVTLALWVTDEDGERWVDLEPTAYIVALDPHNPRRLAVMPIEPWAQNTRYRATVRNVLRDGFGRAVVFPGGGDSYETDATVPAAPCDEEKFEGYPKQYPLEFDTVEAAGAWFACEPVPVDPQNPPDPPAGPERCFPGGLNLLFQGLWHDPVTGLAYARSRWYDARTAHWLSPDPMGDFDSPNRYAFVSWQPNMYTDPTGEVALVDNVVGGLVSVGIGYGVTCLVGECSDYTWADAGIDFGLGFATSGLSSIGQLRHLRHAKTAWRFGARAALEVGVDVGGEALRHEFKGEDYTFRQLMGGSLVNLGIGELGSHAGKRLMRSWNAPMVRWSNTAGMGGGGVAMRGAPGRGALSRWSRTTTPWQRRVYQRSDIDWDFVRPQGVPLAGKTNWEAAVQGYAPGRINPVTGKWDDVILHHAGQNPRGAAVEFWRSSHGRVPHGMDPPGPWRRTRPDWAAAWQREQSAYWRWRTGEYSPPPTDRLILPGD
jgi:RHS repeat-associated protein